MIVRKLRKKPARVIIRPLSEGSHARKEKAASIMKLPFSTLDRDVGMNHNFNRKAVDYVRFSS